MQKVGRNDPCPCGSGKKFKKCCEEKVRHKKFEATVISTADNPLLKKAKQIGTGFFKKKPLENPPAEPDNPPPTEM
jgi:hypothetical protein